MKNPITIALTAVSPLIAIIFVIAKLTGVVSASYLWLLTLVAFDVIVFFVYAKVALDMSPKTAIRTAWWNFRKLIGK